MGGLRIGFVGGAPLPPGRGPHRGGPWTPHVLRAEEYTAAVARARPGRRAVQPRPARRARAGATTWSPGAPEATSTALLDVVHRDRPRAALFGHVHQPLAARVRVGRTECVNVGHFRRTGRPYVLLLVATMGNLPAMADATTSSITIAAPPERVMAVIADFPAYPEWADQVKTRRGPRHRRDGRGRAGAVHDGRRARSRTPTRSTTRGRPTAGRSAGRWSRGRSRRRRTGRTCSSARTGGPRSPTRSPST